MALIGAIFPVSKLCYFLILFVRETGSAGSYDLKESGVKAVCFLK